MHIHTNATSSTVFDTLYANFSTHHSNHLITRHQDALDYFYLSRLINNSTDDWFIYLDVDCLLLQESALENLIDYMTHHDYTICGIPDGGSIPIRHHHPNCINPFFVILNRTAITPYLPLYATQSERSCESSHFISNTHLASSPHLPYEFCDCEASVLFNWKLIQAGAPYLYLDTFTGPLLSSYPSTYVLSPWHTPIAIHAWAARDMTLASATLLHQTAQKASYAN